MAPHWKKRPGFWPTRDQILLLQAALLEKKVAFQSFQAWREHNELENMDEGSYRLIPLIYHNLSGFQINDPIFVNFKEISLNFWVLNERMFKQTLKIIRKFNHAGIEVTLLKGMPLIFNYYQDPSLRPMGDIDILVPQDAFFKGIDLLVSEGWSPSLGNEYLSTIDDYLCAVNFVKDETHLDLHWQVIPSIKQEIFRKTILDNNNFSLPSNSLLKGLEPTDELFHICVHGARYNRIPPIRWITDSYYILKRKNKPINWNRFNELAEKTDRLNEARDTLLFLKTEFNLAIPENAIPSNIPNISVISVQYYLLTHPIPILWDLFNKYFYYRDFNREDNFWLWNKKFIIYLKITWGIQKDQNIFIYILRLFVKRLYIDLFIPPYFSRKPHSVDNKPKESL